MSGNRNHRKLAAFGRLGIAAVCGSFATIAGLWLFVWPANRSEEWAIEQRRMLARRVFPQIDDVDAHREAWSWINRIPALLYGHRRRLIEEINREFGTSITTESKLDPLAAPLQHAAYAEPAMEYFQELGLDLPDVAALVDRLDGRYRDLGVYEWLDELVLAPIGYGPLSFSEAHPGGFDGTAPAGIAAAREVMRIIAFALGMADRRGDVRAWVRAIDHATALDRALGFAPSWSSRMARFTAREYHLSVVLDALLDGDHEADEWFFRLNDTCDR